ncbi:MAG: HAMP domain-containing histidine kinase, partial [Bacteroidales bacterium]|nr:HAMP domain-containing histidine kinase [Bacteroidales bacterium]
MRLLSKSVGKKELLERIGALEAENQHLQKEIEGSNQNSGALLSLILENEDLFFFIYSTNNQNLTFNIEPENFFGIKINNKLEDLLNKVHNDDKEKVKELFKLNFSSKLGSCTFRLANITETRDQRIFRVTLRKQKVQELAEGDYLCTLQNVTKEVKSKKDIIKSKEKAEESDKLKNTLLSRISQYIRTPLNSIVGFAELLTIYDPGELQRKEFLDIIKRQSKTLLDVINDISEIARYSTGDIEIKKTPIDLNLVVNELIIGCEQLRPEKRKQEVKLETSFPNNDGIKIFSDSGRIQQIVSNILNHVQGLIDRGIITIGYKSPEDGKIELFVNDNNTYIPKEEQKNYFNKYASNDTENNSKYDESGIGLAIAKVVVKA